MDEETSRTKPRKSGFLLFSMVVNVLLIGIILGGGFILYQNRDVLDLPFKENEIVTRENYNKINGGMTKQEVKSILGEPSYINETELFGMGKTETYAYKEKDNAISIIFSDSKAYTKSWGKGTE